MPPRWPRRDWRPMPSSNGSSRSSARLADGGGTGETPPACSTSTSSFTGGSRSTAEGSLSPTREWPSGASSSCRWPTWSPGGSFPGRGGPSPAFCARPRRHAWSRRGCCSGSRERGRERPRAAPQGAPPHARSGHRLRRGRDRRRRRRRGRGRIGHTAGDRGAPHAVGPRRLRAPPIRGTPYRFPCGAERLPTALRAAPERLLFKRGTLMRFPSPLRGPPFRSANWRPSTGDLRRFRACSRM